MLDGIPLSANAAEVFFAIGGWVGLFYMVRQLFTGKLSTGRELEEKETRIQNLEQVIKNQSEQIETALWVLPQIAEVLKKFHAAGEEVRRGRESSNG